MYTHTGTCNSLTFYRDLTFMNTFILQQSSSELRCFTPLNLMCELFGLFLHTTFIDKENKSNASVIWKV